MNDERLAAVRLAAHELEAMAAGFRPRALVILGSGLAGAADAIEAVSEFPFAALSGYASSSVAGHQGRFVFGTLAGRRVLAMFGRIHLYEGHTADQVVLPVRAAAMIGCDVMIATNAAGAIAPRLRVGQTMLVSDHINLMGANPLVGANFDELGERFPAMAGAYCPHLASLAREVADESDIELAEGVYAGVLGPSYETRAEVHFLDRIGADAVGMSTVPEVIAAQHAGMHVAAFSLIANVAAEPVESHEQVLTVVEEGAGAVATLVAGILARL